MKPWLGYAVPFLLGLLGSALGGAIVVLPTLAGIAVKIESTDARVDQLERSRVTGHEASALRDRIFALEQGTTTPISREARSELDEHRRQIGELRHLVLDLLAKMKRNESRATVPPRVVPKGG